MATSLFPDVVVNGETIPSAAIAAEAQNHAAPKGKPGLAWRKAAQALTIRALLLQEAARRGLTPDVQELAPGRFEAEDESVIRILLEDALDVQPVSDADIKAEWARDPGRFRTSPLWDVSHILCASDPRDAQTSHAAQMRAQALLGRIGTNAKSFAALAARESDCGSKSAGGALGQLGPGDTVPEFESVLRYLDEGTTTEAPVQSRHGWHLIRLNAVAPSTVLPFDNVAPKIAQALEKAAWAKASKEFVAQLGARSAIAGTNLIPI
ncbi:MAG: peptidylprolyl isomerase [Paracoccus sp. (in: a-proteobacteria)]|uniref:peptidylprolyl isomerase n=1 Tax=Paracoccus sp. TaxID=267 RepID=UPI00391B3D15